MATKTAAQKSSTKQVSSQKKMMKKSPSGKAVIAATKKPALKDAVRTKTHGKVAPRAAERVQLAARKPEKKADKAVAKKGHPAKPAPAKKAAPAATASTKIVSTLKSLLGGASSAKTSKAKAPEKVSKAPLKPAAKVEAAKPAVAVQGHRPGKTGAAAPAVSMKPSVTGSAGAPAPAAKATPVVKSATTTKSVKKAVSKAGSGLTAHGVGDSCREVACENMATTGTYCRMHYIKNWRRIKNKEKILAENRINGFIEELVAKYPEKYIEAIRQDLASEKEFAKVISDLDLDENTDEFEGEGGENAEGIIDTIRRDFDDEGEGF